MPKRFRFVATINVSFSLLLMTTALLWSQPPQPLEVESPPPAERSAPQPDYDLKEEESYTKLANPDVATRMGLDDEQIAKVAALIVERSQKLKDAPLEQWGAIRVESEAKFEALLTEEQKANWQKVLHDKRIAIIFKEQSWAEVLDWFAKQVGLQLIMDVPPSGTFTYADRTEYSPAEALDKLNSVLQAHGYTLVRNENLLLLFNLKRTPHIPPVYLAKLRPEDLVNCKANFEYVAVTYSLGRRDRAAVDAQLRPFLAVNPQIVDLRGNSFMLVDTVASQRIVKKLIDSIPEPEERQTPRAPGTAPPPPSEWQTYVIEKTSPEKVEEIVKQFCGITQIVRLPNSPQLHVLGTQDQQRNVRQIIDRVEVDPGTTFAPVVEVYSLDQLAEATPQQLWVLYSMYGFRANVIDLNASFVEGFLNIIKEVVPNAVTVYEKNNRKLIVLAVPDDQQKIAGLVEKLKRSSLAENTPMIKVYQLKTGSPSFIRDIVQNVEKFVPKAIVDFNTADRCLLVVGTADEHKMITDTMKELENLDEGDIERKMVCYPVNQVLLQRFNTLWRQLRLQPEFEGVLELSENRDNQLTIWATADQHVRFRQMLNELTGAGEGNSDDGSLGGDGTTSGTVGVGGSKKLMSKSFVIRRGEVDSLRYILPQVIPGISVMPEYRSRSIFVFGTEESIKAVEDFVNKVDNEYGINVIVLSVSERITPEMLNAMRMMFRDYGTVIFDEKNMRLIAYGRKADLEQVEQFVATFNKSASDEPKTIFVQPVERTMPDHLVEFVRDSVPHAEIQYDGENKRFTIAGTKANQLLASKLILEAEASLPPREQIRFFPVGRVVSDKMIDLIKNQVQYITEIKRDDQDPMTLFVKAQPAVLDEIEALLVEINEQLPTTAHNKLVAYPVTPTERSRFDKLQEDLKKEIGEFRTMDDDRKNLMVIWALPQQHERIAALFETVKTEAPVELQEQIIMHSLRFTDAKTIQDLVKEMYPDINIREDAVNNRLIIRVPMQLADAVKLMLDQIDSQDPNSVKRYFASYPIGSVNMIGSDGISRNYSHLLQELQRLVPNAKLSFDYVNSSIIVWGTDEEQQRIKETIQNVHNTEPADRFGRFPLRRAEPYGLIAIVERMFRTSMVSYDAAGKTLVVQSVNSEQLRLIGELIKKLDPAEPGPNDLQVQFYQLKEAAPPYLITTLYRLVPTAYVVPDDINRQLMVLARPSEHDLIRQNVDLIVSTFTPDEPVLFVYSVTTDQRKRIEAFVTTAAAELRGLRIVADERPGQMSIWARPLEHQLINDALIMMSANTDADFELDFKAFSLTAVDADTVKEVLGTRVPEAKLVFDEKGMRMLVWASKSDMVNVTKTFETLDPTTTKNLKYMAYPVALGAPETILESIKQVYPNIKSQVDERNQRLLIWATPEEHAAIAEMIEQTNTDTGVTLQERYQSYPIPKLTAYSVQTMLTALFPGVEVYGDAFPPRQDALPRITVRAMAREHEQIKTLLEQMQSTDDQYHAEFAIYPIGNADPVTLEAMLQGMFPNAESLTSYEIKNLLQDDPMRQQIRQNPFMAYYYNTMSGNSPMNRQQRQRENMTGTREGCFKVDPGTRTIMVYLPTEDQKKIAAMIESIADVVQTAGKMSVRTYELEEGFLYYYIPVLQEIVPTAKISEGFRSEIIVYASDEDHAQIQQCVDEMNMAGRPESQWTMEIMAIPDGSAVPRRVFIQQINYGMDFPGYMQEGPLPNQVIFRGRKGDIPKIQKLLDDVAKDQLEYANATPEVYTLNYISVANAKKWLKAVVPNAQYDFDETANVGRYSWVYEEFGLPRPTSSVDDPTARVLVIRATPLDHKLIAETLKVIDVDLPEDIKPVPRDYSFENYPPRVLYSGFRALIQAFPAPKATFVLNDERVAIVAVAAPQTHKEIDDFLKSYFEQKETEQPKIEVYALEKVWLPRIQQVLRLTVPQATILQGMTPDQVVIYARPIDQQKVVEIIAKMQSITVPENTMQLKVYQVPPASLTLATQTLQTQIVGGLTWANYADSTMIVFGSELEHELAARLTQSMGESFPELVTKTYFTKNIPVGQAYGFLLPQFVSRANFYVRTDTGDLIAHATPSVHEEIQKSIDAIDVSRPVESEKIVVVHNFHEMAPGNLGWVIQAMVVSSPGVIIYPSPVPGQLIVYTTPVEQLKLQKIVDEMLAKDVETQEVAENYSLKSMTATAAWYQILAQIAPYARVGFSTTDPHKITIWDKPSSHEKIKAAVDKLNESVDGETVARMYRFQRVSWSTAQQMILSQFPGMYTGFDPQSNSLVVHASPEEHRKIAAIVAEIDKYDPKTQVCVQIHNTGAASAQQLLQGLTLFYTTSPGFRAVQDTTGRNLIITATPQQHELVASLIKQISEGGMQDPNVTLVVYDLEKFEWYTILSALRQFFYRQGVEFNPTYDSMSDKMMVLARPQEHAAINLIMNSFRAEERELVIFALLELDPETVRTMVTQLFYEEPISKQPSLQIDYYSDLLYIRATKSQHEKIRQLLAQFGETGELQPTAGVTSPVNYQPSAAPQLEMRGNSNFRTIQFDGNADELIEKLQKIWPQINPNNPLVVLNGEKQETSQTPGQSANEPLPQTFEQPVAPQGGYRAPQGLTGTEGPKVYEIELDERLADAIVLEEIDAVALVLQGQPTPQPASQIQEVPSLGFEQTAPQAIANQQTTEAQPSETQTQETNAQTMQVYLMVNDDGTISVVSNDTAALDRLALALAEGNPQIAAEGGQTTTGNAARFNRVKYEDREYTEYEIRNLAPSVLALRLQMRLPARFPNRSAANMYSRRGQGGFGGFGGYGGYGDYGGYASSARPPMPTLLPQDELNSLIVRGTKRDRVIVAEMIDELDVPDPIYMPEHVYVKNTDPLKVFQELMTVYGRVIGMTRLPNGLKPTVTVDRLTDAIVIQGPDELVQTLKQYIEETDKRLAEQPSKRIHVVPLEKVNSTMVNMAIQQLYRKDYQQYYYGLPYSVPMYQPNYGVPNYGVPNYNMPGNYGRRAY